MKTLKELLEMRAAKIAEIAEAKSEEALNEIKLELKKLDAQIEEARKLEAKTPEEKAAEERSSAQPDVVKINHNAEKNEKKGVDLDKLATEIRSGKPTVISAEAQREVQKRAIASSTTQKPAAYKSTLEEAPNQVAQAIDLVAHVPMKGAARYEVAFEVDVTDADYTAEAGAYTTAEGTFNTNDTVATKLTAKAVVNEEVKELNTIDYLDAIINNVKKSLRKKASKEIVAGDGTTGHLRGIANAPAKVMPADYKLDVRAFDKNTLRNIIMAYGGDEDVTSPLTLFLNKNTLNEFLAVELKSGDPAYNVKFEGTGGTISEAKGGLEVPFSINSGFKAFSAEVAGKTFAVYGDPQKYELPEFSDMIVVENDAIYQDKGQIAFFGHQHLGGVVAGYKAFLPIKKLA
nr:MAG TPA: major capsid protein [Caudoviricetes sp.]